MVNKQKVCSRGLDKVDASTASPRRRSGSFLGGTRMFQLRTCFIVGQSGIARRELCNETCETCEG